MAAKFNFFWYGDPLPILHWAGLASFVRLGHDVKLYAYQKLDVPRGVRLEDAGAIIPFQQLFMFANPQTGKPDVGPFSDLFRFKLLMERGGWWSDTDVICFREDIPCCRYAWAQECPEIDPSAVAPGQIKFPAGDPLIVELYQRCLEASTKIESREHIGPKLFSRTLAGHPLPEGHWGSPEEFYPIRWIETFKFWLPDFKAELDERFRSAVFTSTWNSMHLYAGMSAKMPPAGSWLDYTFRSLAPERLTGERYTREEALRNFHAFLHRNRHYAYSELESICGSGILSRLGLSPESDSRVEGQASHAGN